MFIIKYRKIFFIFSGVLVLASIIALTLWQFNFGIDFIGGSLLEIEWTEKSPTSEQVNQVFSDLELADVDIRVTENNGMFLRFKDVNEEIHQNILSRLEEKLGKVEEKRFEAIGPIIGEELKKKAIWSISLALIVILIFVAWAFKKVSFPVKSYRYGLIAVIALFHDVLIVMGVFSVLGKFGGVEIGVPFVAAILTILGYSVNDSIVIFDRIRENLLDYKNRNQDFKKTVGQSLRQTIIRSLNTSLTTLLVLLAIFFFGGASIHYFILALILGIILGTYSSLFIASPLLISWEKKTSGNY